MIRRMEWLISVGLLVAVAAWVAGVCHRLQLLRNEVCNAWEAWMADARRRNETLGEFAAMMALLLPPGEMQPRTLRRLLADSERVLRRGQGVLWQADAAAEEGERALRQEAERAVRRAEEESRRLTHEGLQSLGASLAQRLERQGQSSRRLQLAAEAYNAALREPPLQAVAASLGFRCASLPVPHKNARLP